MGKIRKSNVVRTGPATAGGGAATAYRAAATPVRYRARAVRSEESVNPFFTILLHL